MRRLEEVKYRKPLLKMKDVLEKMNIKPETDIEIYPIYPFDWYGIFGAHDRVWIFRSRKGVISLAEIQPVHGFGKNGRLILKGDRYGQFRIGIGY